MLRRVSLLLMALLAAPVMAEMPDGVSPMEQECYQQLEGFIVLNNAPEQGELEGVSQVGLSSEELQIIIDQEGYCSAWQALVESYIRQHGEVLDSVERMTGLPTPGKK
ncbi:hypothetical protein ACFSJ3_19015 [Corallincola platygyrae]|uniref:Uncharacterized protein n=1 Tax=Corallincola platygyrae TaxID=1193278 RepID=A0ABW4XSK6_9GAMM